jgi:hypothetical protein
MLWRHGRVLSLSLLGVLRIEPETQSGKEQHYERFFHGLLSDIVIKTKPSASY